MSWFYLLGAAQMGIPFLTSLLLILAFRKSETGTRRLSIFSCWLTFVSSLGTVALALWRGLPVELDYGVLFETDSYHFSFSLYYDLTTVVFLTMTALLATLVVNYSKIYMHREKGYTRFFSCIFLFWTGLNLLFCAGSLDLLFAGWEIVGVSSFLLISFYWQRRSPAKNAFQAYCVYRFCDVGLLLGAWLNHALWHGAEHFSELTHPETLAILKTLDPFLVSLLGALVILAAAGKSAQFPFLFWLPKAMEGPTPSSAIFYGALSVHAGVFLLIRASALWHASAFCVALVIVVGLSTVLVATAAGWSQSNIKAQIAYASAAQVGLQFIEVALGFETLALIHFVANASFRCYQLLISPSVVAYVLRLQGSVNGQLKVSAGKRWQIPASLRSTLYVFSLSGGYIEPFVHAVVLAPLRLLGAVFRSRSRRGTTLKVGAGLVFGIALIFWLNPNTGILDFLSFILCLCCLMSAFLAVTEPARLRWVWAFTGLSSALAAISVLLQRPYAAADVNVYLYGLVAFWALGAFAVVHLEKIQGVKGQPFSQGAGNSAPIAGFVLLIAFLGTSGFPLSPTFLGEDLLLHHATKVHEWMAAVLSLAFVVNGIAIMRSIVPLHFSEYVR